MFAADYVNIRGVFLYFLHETVRNVTYAYLGSCKHSECIAAKFYWGRFSPEVLTFTLLYTIFDQKGNLLIAPSIENGLPFTYLQHAM